MKQFVIKMANQEFFISFVRGCLRTTTVVSDAAVYDTRLDAVAQMNKSSIFHMAAIIPVDPPNEAA